MKVSEFFNGLVDQVREIQADGDLDNDAAELGIDILTSTAFLFIDRRGDIEAESDPLVTASLVVYTQAHAGLMAALGRMLHGCSKQASAAVGVG